MVDVNQMIGIAVIVLVGFIAITLLASIGNVANCTTITNTTLGGACNSFFNNAATLFSIIAVLLLLLVIPMIRGVLGNRGG